MGHVLVDNTTPTPTTTVCQHLEVLFVEGGTVGEIERGGLREESTTQIEDIINGFKTITDNASRSIITSHKLADQTSAQASEMEQTFADILMDVNSISDMATQIATASEQQVAVTRELAGNMESVSEAALLTLTGSQEITEVTQEQARLARQLQDLANEFKVA